MDSELLIGTETLIRERLQSVQANIQDACLRSGRKPSDITLVAITKYFPKSIVSKACALEISHIGENRIQESIEKYEDGWLTQEYPNVQLHLVGHLQTNKVRSAVQLFHSIDSIDSLRLAEAIQTAAYERGKQINVLLEVNTSGEPQKFGIQPDEVRELASQVIKLDNLKLSGLMTVGPNIQDNDEIRKSFRILRETFEKVRDHLHPPFWSVLSMGMSHDYQIAIEEGATEIRLGTALFGERS